MKAEHSPINLYDPAVYRIEVAGRLGEKWENAFPGIEVRFDRREVIGSITVLEGTVADQSALFGLLTRVRDLGLPLISVHWIQKGDMK